LLSLPFQFKQGIDIGNITLLRCLGMCSVRTTPGPLLFDQQQHLRERERIEQERVLRRLDAIDAAKSPEALNVPGFDFHGLQGKPKRYSVHVDGRWCITFEWQGENAVKVDLENYH
jgi:proteic killer suppression protein